MGPLIATGACMAIRGWRLMRTDSSPSEISSSEMPDSSSSSINFFTLRMSIREPLSVSLVLGVAQTGAYGFERELVADGPQSENAANRDVRQIRMLPIPFTGEQIAQMYLDERYTHPEKRVAQGNAGVRVARRIDDYGGNAFALGGLNPLDQFVFGIALERDQVMTFGAGQAQQLGLDALQSGHAVNALLARAEKIQIRTI